LKIVVSLEQEIKSVAIELARACALPKPWGILDLRPWGDARHDGSAIGELWYERSGREAAKSSLLLKILFTNQPLSIQVHPDDAFAHSIGLPCGKTEAWYVLRAAPEAKVALGLNQRLTAQQLRAAVDDGSISNLVVWQAVSCGDAIFVPAGTIHAIGAGLVIAEIQQRSDATFRLFDHGRQRALHVENAVAAAHTGPAHVQGHSIRLSEERTLLISSPYFALERIDLPPDSTWRLDGKRETWCLVLSGDARIKSFDMTTGNALFVQSDSVDLHAGPTGLVGLVAYTGEGPVPILLQRARQPGATDQRPSRVTQAPPLVPRAKTTTSTNEHLGLSQ
jgi:mannose-6-phosphate isomerase